MLLHVHDEHALMASDIPGIISEVRVGKGQTAYLVGRGATGTCLGRQEDPKSVCQPLRFGSVALVIETGRCSQEANLLLQLELQILSFPRHTLLASTQFSSC